MSEFASRIDAQRKILEIVNSRRQSEPLFGLSATAIDRWVEANRVPTSSRELKLLLSAANSMNLLANKSQEQITDEYLALSAEVKAITSELRTLFSSP